MVEVTCSYTGLTFEAATRRTKNHPEITAWLDSAYKNQWFNGAVEALKSGREQGFTTLEQFTGLLKHTEQSSKEQRHAEIKAQVQWEAEQKEAKRQRFLTNAFLRKWGYRWSDLGYSEDEEIDNSYTGPTPRHDWQLFSPDRRAVTVEQAMQELAYQDAKYAKDWLAERAITEETPLIEMKRMEHSQRQQGEQERQYTDEQIGYQQEAMSAFIEAGLSPERASQEATRLSLPHTPLEDVIHLSSLQVSGANATLVINGDFRYGVLLYSRWYGIEEIIAEYPETTNVLSLYAERNRKQVS